MYCVNCGTKIDDNNKFCTNCGTPKHGTNEEKTEQKPIPTETPKVSTTEDDKTANLLCILSLCAKYGIGLITAVISYIFPPLAELIGVLAPLSGLTGLVLMIVARIKYPNNKFAKVLMWIYIIEAIITVILVIVIVVACAVACGTMDLSGCN